MMWHLGSCRSDSRLVGSGQDSAWRRLLAVSAVGALALGLSGCGGEKEEKPTPSASASFSPSDCPTPGENGAVPVPPSDEKLAEYCDQLQNQTEVPETELDKYIPRDMQQYYNMPYAAYINEPTDETYGFMKSIIKTDVPIHKNAYETFDENYIPYEDPKLSDDGQKIMDGMVYLFQESLLQWDRTEKTDYKVESDFLDPTALDFNPDMATKVMPYMFHYTDSEDIVKAYDEGEFYYTFNNYAKDQNKETAQIMWPDTWKNTNGGPWKYEVLSTSDIQEGTDMSGNKLSYKDIKAIAPTGENVIVRAYWEKTADGKGDHWSIGQAIVDQDKLPELPTN